MIRVGYSEDIHRLKDEGNGIYLGGIFFPIENKSVIAHSDGDVILHAMSEAILSSVGLSDLGTYFDDKDENIKGISSVKILDFALKELEKRSYKINNIVVNLILERPRLKEYKEKIKLNLAKLLNINLEDISFIVGSNEGLDSLGSAKAIKSVCMLSIKGVDE